MHSQTNETSEFDERPWWERHRESLGVTLCSVAVHIALLALLAMIVIPGTSYDLTNYVTVRTQVIENPALETTNNLKITPEKLIDNQASNSASMNLATDVLSHQPSPMSVDTEQKELQWELDAIEYIGSHRKHGDLSGRTEEARSIMLKAFGGTATSEAAVNGGLKWLKNHQNEDGSWNFNHLHEGCGDSCTLPGTLSSNTVGATSMALLCFVGAGHTHESGDYQDIVRSGLAFLNQKYLEAEQKGDMRGTTGNSGMYVQGLTTILLCEVYGLTRDRKIRKVAQECVDFILEAQHPENGGWRYRLQQPDGDTSVVGWQVMALTSAKMAGLTVPGRAKVRAERFLDSVQLEEGAHYGYARPEKKASTTSIGLLCRMYYGWDSSNPALRVGVEYLEELGPSNDNQYYNYYATQVLHHWGGAKWKKWNRVMREQLISTQETTGHAAGSWAPRDPHSRSGGRLYSTCLSILTLEVYYRHLPLYQRRMTQTEF